MKEKQVSFQCVAFAEHFCSHPKLEIGLKSANNAVSNLVFYGLVTIVAR